jgi:hypothetical protein
LNFTLLSSSLRLAAAFECTRNYAHTAASEKGKPKCKTDVSVFRCCHIIGKFRKKVIASCPICFEFRAHFQRTMGSAPISYFSSLFVEFTQFSIAYSYMQLGARVLALCFPAFFTHSLRGKQARTKKGAFVEKEIKRERKHYKCNCLSLMMLSSQLELFLHC